MNFAAFTDGERISDTSSPSPAVKSVESIGEAQANKMLILGILAKVNLDVVPLFSSITAANLEDVML